LNAVTERERLHPEEPEIVTPEIIPIRESKKETTRSAFIIELETNLAIATTPWADKLIFFQTGANNRHIYIQIHLNVTDL